MASNHFSHSLGQNSGICPHQSAGEAGKHNLAVTKGKRKWFCDHTALSFSQSPITSIHWLFFVFILLCLLAAFQITDHIFPLEMLFSVSHPFSFLTCSGYFSIFVADFPFSSTQLQNDWGGEFVHHETGFSLSTSPILHSSLSRLQIAVS